MEWKDSILRIFGNAGLYFITPLAGTTLAQAPSIEASLYSTLIGVILSASREALFIVDTRKRNRKL